MALSDTSDSIKKEFPEFLKRNLGNVAIACEKANIARQTYYAWRSEDKEFDTECHNVLESLMDRAESLMYKKMFVDEDTTMLIFFAKTKMKHRGYVERMETTGKDGGAIEVTQTPLQVRNQELIKKATGDQ